MQTKLNEKFKKKYPIKGLKTVNHQQQSTQWTERLIMSILKNGDALVGDKLSYSTG